MGGRGAYSTTYRDGLFRKRRKDEVITLFADADLNFGATKATNPTAAAERFRDAMLKSTYEFGAYIDEDGFIHELTSTHDKTSVLLAPLGRLAHERGIVATIHNHPTGLRRKYGGSFSLNDILAQNADVMASAGKLNVAYARAKEGIYKAVFTKGVVDSKHIQRVKKQREIRIGKLVTKRCPHVVIGKLIIIM